MRKPPSILCHSPSVLGCTPEGCSLRVCLPSPFPFQPRSVFLDKANPAAFPRIIAACQLALAEEIFAQHGSQIYPNHHRRHRQLMVADPGVGAAAINASALSDRQRDLYDLIVRTRARLSTDVGGLAFSTETFGSVDKLGAVLHAVVDFEALLNAVGGTGVKLTNPRVVSDLRRLAFVGLTQLSQCIAALNDPASGGGNVTAVLQVRLYVDVPYSTPSGGPQNSHCCITRPVPRPFHDFPLFPLFPLFHEPSSE
jgi:hypothetical protein